MSHRRDICAQCDQLADIGGGSATCDTGVCVVMALRTDIEAGRRTRSPLV